MTESEYNQHHKIHCCMEAVPDHNQAGHPEEHHMIEDRTLVALHHQNQMVVLSERLILVEHTQKTGPNWWNIHQVAGEDSLHMVVETCYTGVMDQSMLQVAHSHNLVVALEQEEPS
ncbi:hypothetical protein CR513_58738 [Mucuna pruriens]|uniref:Uncharacterized protein n=1 Tax=Mucuna pruriens TaxID=157652 RepID=A0A371EA63_MUCPR|nr:hypothetical protein CR513_58738 [Mucuna pruriens]